MERDRLEERRVRLSPGRRIGPLDEPEPIPVADPKGLVGISRRPAWRLDPARLDARLERFRAAA